MIKSSKLAAIGFALAIASATIVPASAQSVLETIAGLKFCRTLKDDAQRLKCFDGLITDKASDQPTTEAEITWAITESKSPVDDSPQVAGRLQANGDTASSAFLILRCKERSTDAYFGRPYTYLGSGNSIKVLVRINNANPIETMWSPSTDGSAVFAPSAIPFIRSLPDKGKLFIRAFGYQGKTADGEFNLGDVSEVREKISRACGWPAVGAKQPPMQPQAQPHPQPAPQPQPQKK